MGVLLLPILLLIVMTYVAILNTPGGVRLRARFPALVGAVLPGLVCLPLGGTFLALGMTAEAVVALLAYTLVVVVFAILADLLRGS
ncbi:hypothetical protein Acsp04_17620 [Actinomadura sp. NBRC 104425]|uniref:hypothetical protein n=1 Tax=Actinomadura sp. NBRC 104425 TaxID=3032204 RepID=UPI0024A30BCA|nr:hypothetical protein [Actinomadura sp. NBRC 104425]GLZ11527.1 hypothetical protein Acsp04_17620 [Actinomadura sp. NBRC 104425]